MIAEQFLRHGFAVPPPFTQRRPMKFDKTCGVTSPYGATQWILTHGSRSENCRISLYWQNLVLPMAKLFSLLRQIKFHDVPLFLHPFMEIKRMCIFIKCPYIQFQSHTFLSASVLLCIIQQHLSISLLLRDRIY